MRDLLNIIEQLSNPLLTEATRGLLYREPGDKFFKGDPENPEQILVFDEVKYFPKQPGAYETFEDMTQAFEKLEKKFPIVVANTPKQSMRAFALLKMHDEKTQQPLYFAKFFGEIQHDMTGRWTNKELLGYQLQKATSLKASYGLKPSDIFPNNSRFKSIQQLYAAFKMSPKTTTFIAGFSMLFGRSPKLPVFENSEKYFTAIRDDLGEIIGPVAMIQGLNVGTGAEAAKRDLLGTGESWTGSSISFPKEKNNGLVDSYIVTTSGVEVGISSKGENGATASVKNINDGITYIKEKGTDEQKKLLTKYAPQIKILNDVGTASSLEFPLRVGVNKGFISEETALAIRSLIDNGAKTLNDLDFSEDTMIELINLTQTKGAKNEKMSNYNVGYRALASLAEVVADDINSDPVFGEACLKFLNSSPVIQLHASASKNQNGDVTLTGFTSKYPPNFQGTVKLDPTKTYSATGAAGRMGFAYKGKDAGVDNTPALSTKSFNKAASKIASGKSIDSSTEQPKNKVGDIGRKKR